MSLYRFLEDAYIAGMYYQAGTTAATADAGGTLPPGWVPNGNVDPIDVGAISDFFNAGPQPLGLVRQQWSDKPVQLPNTYWDEFKDNLKFKTIPPEDFEWATTFTQGAVQMTQGSYISGSGASTQLFPCGVLSSWINLSSQTASTFGAGPSNIFQSGSTSTTFNPVGVISVGQWINIGSDFVGDVSMGLSLCTIGGIILQDTFVAVGPIEGSVGGGPGKIHDWHHCIWSWDTTQLVTIPSSGEKTTRLQFAWDRGGTPFEGSTLAPGGIGGVYDTILGIQTGGWPFPSPQPMWDIAPDARNGVTGLCSTSAGRPSEWTIDNRAPTCAIGYAYCFFGVSNQFFDLTNPDNLDLFISPNLEAMNLQYTIDESVPLLPIWQHSGGATAPPGSGAALFYNNNVNGTTWANTTGIKDAPPGPHLGSI